MADQERISTVIQFETPGPLSWEIGNDIHVWKFPVIDTGLKLLTVSERTVARQFHQEADKNRFATGRQMLRFLLSKYLSLRPMDIVISAGGAQKPFIIQPPAPIHFNISHSGEWVLVAIGKGELGVDIEIADPKFGFNDLIPEHFNKTEQLFISDSEDPVAAFYYIWTRKEALTKAWGTGLYENLKVISVLEENSWFELHNRQWALKSFNISANYYAALAYPSESGRIRYLDGSCLFNSTEFKEILFSDD